MELLLFRHGIAEDEGPDGSDASRRLTKQGRERSEAAARGLGVLAETPELIVSSPKVRAVQTAEYAREVFDVRMVCEDVIGDGTAGEVIEWLSGRHEARVMVVGHEPTLSRMVERLCAGEAAGFIDMKKAGCAYVEVDFSRSPPRGVLRWLATSRILRAVAGE